MRTAVPLTVLTAALACSLASTPAHARAARSMAANNQTDVQGSGRPLFLATFCFAKARLQTTWLIANWMFLLLEITTARATPVLHLWFQNSRAYAAVVCSIAEPGTAVPLRSA